MDQIRTKKSGTALLAADVHRHLRDRIMSLEMKPGARLVEDDISTSIDVGRTPVREALLRLEGEGLVSRQRRGWVIEAIEPENARPIFEARICVESYATRVATERGVATAADFVRLEALLRDMEELDRITRAELNRLDRSFHETLVALSGNAIFVEMHQRTQFHYWNLRMPILFSREQTERANMQHRAIFEAVKAREGAHAEALAREHIETTYRIVAQSLAGF